MENVGKLGRTFVIVLGICLFLQVESAEKLDFRMWKNKIKI